jgi:hypothetical protein
MQCADSQRGRLFRRRFRRTLFVQRSCDERGASEFTHALGRRCKVCAFSRLIKSRAGDTTALKRFPGELETGEVPVTHRARTTRPRAPIDLGGGPRTPPAMDGPSRAALMLALAHHLQRAIDAGDIRDQAEAARRLGMSRARLTQLLDLALLPPSIQIEVLDGTAATSERSLRANRSIS